MDEENVVVVQKEVETGNIKEVGIERTKRVGTENSKGTEKEVREEDNVDKISACFDAAESETRPELEVLKSEMKEYCFFRNTSFNDPEDEYELKNGSVLTEKVHLVLTDPPYITCGARGQLSSTHNVLSKRDMENAARPMVNVIAPGAQEHIICSDIMFYYWSRSLCAAKEEVEDVDGNLEGGEEQVLEVFEV